MPGRPRATASHHRSLFDSFPLSLFDALPFHLSSLAEVVLVAEQIGLLGLICARDVFDFVLFFHNTAIAAVVIFCLMAFLL